MGRAHSTVIDREHYSDGAGLQHFDWNIIALGRAYSTVIDTEHYSDGAGLQDYDVSNRHSSRFEASPAPPPAPHCSR
ncbi:hypothetical protein JZ751_025889 [Albula glossodonta]|uniref:Uncharacterized protein n=1 Tax=Albula glossodonta TaxID=121402 RepID=A0A8T2NL16_9TELE|nr:hypothetical protein JZ751_025889 [Albula glossodonta]